MSLGVDTSERLSTLYAYLCPDVDTVHCLKRISKSTPSNFHGYFEQGGGEAVSFCMSSGDV